MNPSARETLEALRRFWNRTRRIPSQAEDLRELARRFVELKGILGHRYLRDARTLLVFVCFQDARGVRQPQDLTSEALLAWSASRAHLDPRTRRREDVAVRAFLGHLHAIGRLPQPFGPFPTAAGGLPYRPHLFSVGDLRRLFSPADASAPVRRRAEIYRTIYACALRASEAAHLRWRDFDAEHGTLFIRQTKFYKDRLLPLHPAVGALLRSHRATRRAGASLDDPLFTNARERAYDSAHLANGFCRDLVRADLHRPARVAGNVRYGASRLHSLRHSFAVLRLLAWYREGADVQAKLPLLSTYLGHSRIEHTQAYLTITAELLRQAQHRFAHRWEREFPLEP